MARLLLIRGWRNSMNPRFCIAAASTAASATVLFSQKRTVNCDVPHGHGHSHANLPSQFQHQHTQESSVQAEHMLFGVPKKGRLYEKIKALLEGAGIEYTRRERIDIAHCSNLPMSLVFLPASDIATYVSEGDVDVGITGEDWVAESCAEVDVLMKLGFGKCNLSVQAPKIDAMTVPDLAGKRIVTSFPVISQKFFQGHEEKGHPTRIKCISGSVEAACGLGLADGIVDLVETGTTMRAAGLEEVAVVMKSQAVLIANPHTKHPELVQVVKRRIEGWLTAQSYVMVTYNVHKSNLMACEKLTPGKTSPSIQPLEQRDWFSVQALVLKKEAASKVDDLLLAGATDTLLTSVLVFRDGHKRNQSSWRVTDQGS